MIILKDSTAYLIFYKNKDFLDYGSSFTATLKTKEKLTSEEIEFSTTVTVDESINYFKFEKDLTTLKNGTYTYKLYINDGTLEVLYETGILKRTTVEDINYANSLNTDAYVYRERDDDPIFVYGNEKDAEIIPIPPAPDPSEFEVYAKLNSSEEQIVYVRIIGSDFTYSENGISYSIFTTDSNNIASLPTSTGSVVIKAKDVSAFSFWYSPLTLDSLIFDNIEFRAISVTLLSFNELCHWVKGNTSISFTSTVDTSHIVDMSLMFDFWESIYSPILDLSNLDTSNVTNMGGMFNDFAGKGVLDLSNFNTSNVTDMGSMFASSSFYALDLSSFDTSNVTNMGAMFQYATRIVNLDLSNFDTSNVTDMNNMFQGDNKLNYLNITGWNTINVTVMNNMFDGAGWNSLGATICGDLNSMTAAPNTNMFRDAQFAHPNAGEQIALTNGYVYNYSC